MDSTAQEMIESEHLLLRLHSGLKAFPSPSLPPLLDITSACLRHSNSLKSFTTAPGMVLHILEILKLLSVLSDLGPTYCKS